MREPATAGPAPTPEPGAAAVARVPLPDGRALVVRPMAPEDAVALQQLFASLPAADVHLRFFTGHPPPASFVARMAHVADRGGTGLVVTVGSAPAGGLVAEASAEPLPGGGAELGITVLPGLRGWLGPYLLDLLAARAARLGIADLQAEVLLENRRMAALLRARGCAVLERDDHPAVERLVIATTGGMPAWPGRHDRVRVLAEAPGGHWRAEDAARRAGFAVITCPGSRPGFRTCPATRGGAGPCRLVAGADVVVMAHRDSSDLLAHHRRWHPSAVLRLDPPPLPGGIGNRASAQPRAAGEAVPATAGPAVPATAGPALPAAAGDVVAALQAAAAGTAPPDLPSPQEVDA